MNRLNFKRLAERDMLFIIPAIVLVIGGYFFFRLLIIGEGIPPYSKEIAVVLLATLLTILITGIMLHKQTEVELSKERNVKLLEAKIDAYKDLLKTIEEVLTSDSVGTVKIQVLNQKVSFVASEEVLKAFGEFARLYIKKASDKGDDEDVMASLVGTLSKLAMEIRYDLATENDKRKFDKVAVLNLIDSNIKIVSLGSQEQFLVNCNDPDKTYFATLFDQVDKNKKLGLYWGKPGFTIKNIDKKVSICRAWPTSTNKGIQVVLEHATADKKARAVALLGKYGKGVEDSTKQLVIKLTPEISADDLFKVICVLAFD